MQETEPTAHAGPIDPLITDVFLPGVGGDGLAQRVVSARPGIKVIYEPFTMAALIQTVREVLSGTARLATGSAGAEQPCGTKITISVILGHPGEPYPGEAVGRQSRDVPGSRALADAVTAQQPHDLAGPRLDGHPVQDVGLVLDAP